MGVTSLLSRYIGRQFLGGFLGVMLVLTGFIWLVEFVELVRRVGGRPGGTVGQAFELSLLKTPETLEMVFPFAILFAAMFTFWRLTRSRELIVTRAAGISAWQFLLPVLLSAFVIGVFRVTLLNPMGATLQAQYEALEDQVIRGATSRLELAPGGLWLRQRGPEGTAILFAEGTAPDRILLENVIVFLFDAEDDYSARIDAPTAALGTGEWIFEDALISEGTDQPRRIGRTTLPTEITESTIEDSFAPPNTLSFWRLPGFIERLEETGFSALRHRLHFHELLAQPLLMVAMVLFAAAFSLRANLRRGGGGAIALAGIALAFLLFILSDLVFALGLAETIPVTLAAWTPAVVAALIATAMLLHLEDG